MLNARKNMYNYKERGSRYGAAATSLITRKDFKTIALTPMIKYEHPVYAKCSVRHARPQTESQNV
jgi:hypothetical protein